MENNDKLERFRKEYEDSLKEIEKYTPEEIEIILKEDN